MSECNYPKQVASVKRKESVLSADLELSVTEKADKYFELFSGYSCVKFTIVDKRNGKRIFPTANIKPLLIKGLKENSSFLRQNRLLGMAAPSGSEEAKEEETSAPYTVKLNLLKNHKGKSLAEIALSPNGQADLATARSIMVDNLTKFPKNQATIDAIDETVKMLKEGTLKKDAVQSASGTIIPLLQSTEFKYKRLSIKNGKQLCYRININYDTDKTRQNPISVTIDNMYAFVKSDGSNGMVEIEYSSAENKTQSTFYMGMDEWCGMIEHIDQMIDAFRYHNFPKLYNLAESSFRKSLAASKEKTNVMAIFGTVTKIRNANKTIVVTIKDKDEVERVVYFEDATFETFKYILSVGNKVKVVYSHKVMGDKSFIIGSDAQQQ